MRKEYYDSKEIAEDEAKIKTLEDQIRAQGAIKDYLETEIAKLGEGDVMFFSTVNTEESPYSLPSTLGYKIHFHKSEKYSAYVVMSEKYEVDVHTGYKGYVSESSGSVNIRPEYESVKMIRYYLEKSDQYEEVDDYVKIVKKGTSKEVKKLETKFCKKAALYADARYDLKTETRPKTAFFFHVLSIIYFLFILGSLIFLPGYFNESSGIILDCYVWNAIGAYGLPFKSTSYLIIASVLLGGSLLLTILIGTTLELTLDLHKSEKRKRSNWWRWRLRAFLISGVAFGISFLLPAASDIKDASLLQLAAVLIVNAAHIVVIAISAICLLIQLYQLIFRKLQKQMKKDAAEIKKFIDSGEKQKWDNLLEEILSYNK